MGTRSGILATLAAWLTADASGNITHSAPPAAGDNSAKLTTTGWFKAEQATEAVQGTAKVATQAVTNAGTDDATIVTPKKLRAGFSISLSGTGYIAFPTWLGGLIIQWANAAVAPQSGTLSFPIAYPSAPVAVFGNMLASQTSFLYSLVFNSLTKTTFGYVKSSSSNGTPAAAGEAFWWMAIGF